MREKGLRPKTFDFCRFHSIGALAVTVTLLELARRGEGGVAYGVDAEYVE